MLGGEVWRGAGSTGMGYHHADLAGPMCRISKSNAIPPLLQTPYLYGLLALQTRPTGPVTVTVNVWAPTTYSE